MSEPLVSVITATFNRARLLRRAWNSLHDQSAIFEWIIVDDGSTDDTTSVVTSFADARITLITLPSNQGVNCARNSGIRKSRGQFVVFLDSDDELCPGVLEIAASTLLDAPGDIGAILMHAEIFETHKPIVSLKAGTTLDEQAIVCQGALRGDCGVMYRAEVFSFQMLPEDLRGCEQVFVYGIARRYKYLCAAFPFRIVHRQSDNLSDPGSVIGRSRDIALSYERILSNHAAILQHEQRAATRFARKALYRYLIAGEYLSALRVYRTAVESASSFYETFFTTLVGMAGLCFRYGLERTRLRYKEHLLQNPTH